MIEVCVHFRFIYNVVVCISGSLKIVVFYYFEGDWMAEQFKRHQLLTRSVKLLTWIPAPIPTSCKVVSYEFQWSVHW